MFDAESGLYYYNARYYDPELGRFIQPDTEISDLSNPQSYNRYSYCENDPLTYNDPSGHFLNAFGDWELNKIHEWFGGGGSSQPANPSSVQALRAQYGAPVYTPLPGPGGKPIATPADALKVVGKNVAGSLLTAIPIGGEEKAAVGLVKKGTSILKNAERGRAAEAQVLKEMGLVKNTEKVIGKEGKSVPDYITKDAIGEIKDRKVVTDSPQLRIQRQAANEAGKTHELQTGVNTKVSKTVQDSSQVIRRPDLGPQ